MKEQILPDQLSIEQASQLIDRLLHFLKDEFDISSRTVENETGVTSLSKARRFDLYRMKRLSRHKLTDILAILMAYYKITIFRDSEKNDYAFDTGMVKDAPEQTNFTHYYYYYYSHWNESVNCAVISFLNHHSKAQLTYYDSDGTPIYQSGRGRVWRTGSTLFLELPNSKPEHISLICLYVGFNRHLDDFDWIAGTYAGTRLRDEAPVCGLILIKKIGTSTSDMPDIPIIKSEIPQVVSELLFGKRMGVLPVIAFSEKDLAKIISQNHNA